MSKIVPKLNLNKTPQAVENNSLMYARNIKLLHDGNIVPDGAFEEINIIDTIGYEVIENYGSISGLNNKIYFFTNIKVIALGGQSYNRDCILEYDEHLKSF